MSPLDRLSHAIARLVWAQPGLTAGAVRRKLAGRDRPRFIDATVRAVELDLVVVHEGALRPGTTAPAAPAAARPIAEQLATALRALQS